MHNCSTIDESALRSLIDQDHGKGEGEDNADWGIKLAYNLFASSSRNNAMYEHVIVKHNDKYPIDMLPALTRVHGKTTHVEVTETNNSIAQRASEFYKSEMDSSGHVSYVCAKCPGLESNKSKSDKAMNKHIARYHSKDLRPDDFGYYCSYYHCGYNPNKFARIYCLKDLYSKHMENWNIDRQKNSCIQQKRREWQADAKAFFKTMNTHLNGNICHVRLLNLEMIKLMYAKFGIVPMSESLFKEDTEEILNSPKEVHEVFYKYMDRAFLKKQIDRRHKSQECEEILNNIDTRKGIIMHSIRQMLSFVMTSPSPKGSDTTLCKIKEFFGVY